MKYIKDASNLDNEIRKKEKIKLNIIKIWSDSINKKNLEKILKDLNKWEKETWEKFIIISSWAVALWKKRVIKSWWNILNFTKSSLASIWQQFLMQNYDKISGINKLVWEILIDDYADNKQLVNTILNLLENNVLIIVNHNDTLHNTELNNLSNKTDNDKNTVFLSKIISENLQNKIIIKRVIYLTNTNWLLDKKKKTVSGWKINSTKDKNCYKKFIEKDKSNSWTWWMESKLNCSFKVLEYWVKKSIISNAKYGLEYLYNTKNSTIFFKK